MTDGPDSPDPEIERLKRRLRELDEANAALARENDAWREREHALRERERESDLIMDNIPNLVSLLSARGVPERINREIIEYTGRTEEELKGWAGSDLVHPEDRPRTIETFKQGIRSCEAFDIVYRMRRFDGVYRWFHARHAPLRNAEGDVFRWCISVSDIDDRVRAEERWRENDLRSRSLIDGIPGFVATLEPRGNVEAVNRRIVEYTGEELEELRNWGTNGIVHPEDVAHVAGIFLPSIAAGVPYEIEQRLRRHDGAYRWFANRGVPAHDAAGSIVRWYVLLIDIDEKKRAEEALRASEGNLRRVINAFPTAVWSTRTDGYCDFLSSRWLDYAGLSAEQAEGWGWAAVIHPEDAPALAERWQSALGSGVPARAEARMRRFDGVYRWFMFLADPLRDESGNVVKWYGTNIDIDDRKRAEEALSQLRSELARISRISSLGILTASVTHEVSQPLSGIITNASTCLRMLGANPPNVEGALETTRRTLRDGNRASEVVARLRAMFVKRTEKSDAVDLNEALGEVVALATADLQRHGVQVRLDLARALPKFTSDRVQIQQVILNLLLNACDAMSAVNDRPRKLVIRTTYDGAAVTLGIQDSGVGLHAADSERLFEAFYTTKSSGMGIGLSVSRSIIESHGGRLWGESNPDFGATFAFSLPVD